LNATFDDNIKVELWATLDSYCEMINDLSREILGSNPAKDFRTICIGMLLLQRKLHCYCVIMSKKMSKYMYLSNWSQVVVHPPETA
jgi:hypothetical protein